MDREKAFIVGVAVWAIWLGGCSGQGEFRIEEAIRRLAGPAPAEQVSMAADPDDPDRRREGVLMLSRHEWGRREKYTEFYALLARRDEDATVRRAALYALGESGNPKYTAEIVDALSDSSPAVRMEAAAILDRRPAGSAVARLCRLAVADESEDVRIGCAKALRHYRRKEVVATLVRCLSDPSFGVRFQARRSLVELTGQDHGYEAADWASLLGRELPATRPANDRPWWDLLGATGKGGGGRKPKHMRPAASKAKGGG